MKPTNRFDAPAGEYGVLYAGIDMECFVVETLIRHVHPPIVDRADLAALSLATLETTRVLNLAELHGRGLHRLHIDAGIVAGSYRRCRNLALGIWQHRDRVDGIVYRSTRNNDLLCIALFDRSVDGLSVAEDVPMLDDLPGVLRILAQYDGGI